jgi:hypothetical protein
MMMKMKMKKFAEESGLLGLRLPRPVEGAVIGFLLFTFITALLWISPAKPLMALLLWPGYLLLLLSEPTFFAYLPNSLSQPAFEILFHGIIFIISAAPPTIFGAMINSRSKAISIYGITFLLMMYYFILPILLCPFLIMVEWLIEKPLG